MKLLLSYFDEKYDDCGKCDNCLSQKRNKKVDYYALILKRIGAGEVTTEQLLNQISESKKEYFLTTLRQMLDAGVVKKVDKHHYLTSN